MGGCWVLGWAHARQRCSSSNRVGERRALLWWEREICGFLNHLLVLVTAHATLRAAACPLCWCAAGAVRVWLRRPAAPCPSSANLPAAARRFGCLPDCNPGSPLQAIGESALAWGGRCRWCKIAVTAVCEAGAAWKRHGGRHTRARSRKCHGGCWRARALQPWTLECVPAAAAAERTSRGGWLVGRKEVMVPGSHVKRDVEGSGVDVGGCRGVGARDNTGAGSRRALNNNNTPAARAHPPKILFTSCQNSTAHRCSYILLSTMTPLHVSLVDNSRRSCC